MREYGGFLALELKDGVDYYNLYSPLKFNCARSALLHVILNNNYSKIYCPIYMCESVKISLKKQKNKIVYYHINERLQPDVTCIEEDAVIIIANYYGITDTRGILGQYKNIIFDNTQAFYCKPIMRKGVYNIYSCRKFFGVCDGAYLIGEEIHYHTYPPYMPSCASYLLDAVTYGTNAAYKLSLQNEQQLETDGICAISDLSDRILRSICYEDVAQKRKANYEYVEERLGKFNELPIKYNVDDVPMVYPLLCHNENLRTDLVDNQIYVAQWWKYILKDPDSNDFEKELSEYLIPVPIDQRYNKDDMERMIQKILYILTGEHI